MVCRTQGKFKSREDNYSKFKQNMTR